MLESVFQSKLIKDIKKKFPGCIVLKNDPKYLHGFPDLTILYLGFYYVLEVKKSRDDYLKSVKRQKNQAYYISKLKNASYIYPEIKEDVIHAMEEAFGTRG